MDIRIKDELTAVATELGGTRAWFIFHQSNGGYYTDGVREKVDEWQPMLPDSTWVAPPEPPVYS